MIDRAGFDRLIGDLGVAVFLSTLGGRLLHCNEAAAELLGFASPAALLTQINDIATQIYDDAAQRSVRIDRLLSDGQAPPFIAKLRRRDGSTFWGSETMRLKRREADREIFVLSTVTDVTPVVAAREALAAAERRALLVLAESEARFRAYAQIAADWHWETDADGRYTYISDGIRRFGLDARDFIGRIPSDTPLAPQRDDPGGSRLLAAQARGEWFKDIVLRHRLHGGREVAFAISGEPRHDDKGAPLGYRGAGRDVTDLVEAERRAASSDALLRDGVESMDQGFLLWDHDDRLVMWNDRVTKIMPHAISPDRRGKTFAACFRIAVRGAFPQRTDAEIDAMLLERQALRERDAVSLLELLDGRVIEIADRRTSDGRRITLYRDVTQAHRALQLIAESESRFRDGIESMDSGFALWDRDMKLVAWNRRLVDIMPHLAGLLEKGASEESIYWQALERNRPDASADQRAQLRSRRVEGSNRNGATELELASGRIVEVSDRRTFEGGRVSIYRDVTELRRAERGMRDADAQFRDAIESMEQGLVLWGPDDRAVVWNERAKQLLPHVSAIMSAGIDFRDAYRRSARWAYPQMTDAEVERALQRRLDGRLRQETSQLILPDGRIIEALDRRTSVGGYITIYRDVTDSRRMLVALAISEQRFRDFAETTADWFWEQNAELRFTFVSDSSLALTGLAPEAHHGRTLRETAPLGVAEAEWREHDAMVARRERFAEFRIERIDPRGKRRYLSLTGKPFFDVDGAFAGYRGTGRDVTAIVEAERALDAALRKARERA